MDLKMFNDSYLLIKESITLQHCINKISFFNLISD